MAAKGPAVQIAIRDHRSLRAAAKAQTHFDWLSSRATQHSVSRAATWIGFFLGPDL